MPKKINKEKIKDKEIKEDIINIDYNDEMQTSYINYSLSVITDRAIPDVRDGLKPVHRRILWDMKLLGLKNNGPYKKSARIVGETMGKFHPHGDSSIYDAMVHMAQGWCYLYPLVDGHGNFGSIEGDGAAASRYTEAKLSKLAEEIYLADIDKGIVDFRDNFDNSEVEPSVIPVQLPNILVSGTEGIAVGMASKMPSHNLGEVADACVAMLDNPEITTEGLMQYIKGPDFATGGIVSNASELPSIYEAGQGKIHIRGKAAIEDGEKGKKNIVITEIPYTMIGSIDKFMDTIADMARTKTMPDVTDIRNLSDKNGIKIIVELRKGADAQHNLNLLYKKAKLEDTFGYNALLLNNGTPEQMSLRKIISEFLKFYTETTSRKFQYLLEKELKQKEIKDGLVKAIDCIDAIIEALRGAKTSEVVKRCLTTGNVEGIKFRTKTAEKIASKFCFTEIQANAILDMKLQRLIGLELDALLAELKQHEKNIDEYQSLLNSKTKMKNYLKHSLLLNKNKYEKERKTEITDAEKIVIHEQEIPEEDVYVLINRFNYIKTIDESTYERNKESIPNDYKYCIRISNRDKLAIFSDLGKCYFIKVVDIPSGKYNDKGTPVEQLSDFTSEENMLYLDTYTSLLKKELIFITEKAMVKRVPGSEFESIKRTINATKTNDGDKLFAIDEYNEDKTDIFIISNKKLAIRFKTNEISQFKKNSVGVLAYKLSDNERVMTYAMGTPGDTLTIDSVEIPFSRVRISKRNGKGTRLRYDG